MEKLRGGIIGFGHIAAKGHVPGYMFTKGAQIVAAFDPEPSRAQALSELLPGARFCHSAEELFSIQDLDFVDISAPPAFHAGYICRALEHGLHVLCEKPLVLSLEELEAAAGLAGEKGLVLFTVHNWRHCPIIQEVDWLLASAGREEAGAGADGFGGVRRIVYEVIRTGPSVAVDGPGGADNWRLDPEISGGGILVDHGWHAFYLVNQWMGAVPIGIEAGLENRRFTGLEVEDTASVRLIYPGGREAELFFTWAGDQRRNTISIEAAGGRRLLVLDDHIVCEEGVQGGCGRKVLKSFEEGLSHGSHHPDWYGMVIEEFVAEIRDPGLRGRNLEQASMCLRMLDAARRSALEGRRIGL